jgi:SAM-dependent methyltransferase
MRFVTGLLLGVCLYGQAQPSPASPQLTLEQFKKRIAAYPPDQQVYEIWRFWLVGQPPEVQKLFDEESTKPKGLELYRKELQFEGDAAPEIDRKLRIIDKDGEHWEIERWNQTLTSNSPRINWEPNAFLMQMVKGRKPGRALDVGMGQGRNALWLAQQGWETTGYDPAEKAVALARENAAKAGAKINAVVAKDGEFDMGTAKWDLVVLSYVDIRGNAERVMRALAPGGIVVAEYFHDASGAAPGGFTDNELLRLFPTLRVLRYEDTEGISDFGKINTRLVRLCAEKRQ